MPIPSIVWNLVLGMPVSRIVGIPNLVLGMHFTTTVWNLVLGMPSSRIVCILVLGMPFARIVWILVDSIPFARVVWLVILGMPFSQACLLLAQERARVHFTAAIGDNAAGARPLTADIVLRIDNELSEGSQRPSLRTNDRVIPVECLPPGCII
jgi:hypothetical protein